MSDFELQYTAIDTIRSRTQNAGAGLAGCAARLRRQAGRLNHQKGFGLEKLRADLHTAAGSISTRSQNAYAIAAFLSELSAEVSGAENAAYSILAGAVPKELTLTDAVVPWLPAIGAVPGWAGRIDPRFGDLKPVADSSADWRRRREEAAGALQGFDAAKKAVEEYIPHKGQKHTTVTEENKEDYKAKMKDYIAGLEKKGYKCCEMNKAFRLVQAVGKGEGSIRAAAAGLVGEDYNGNPIPCLPFKTGALKDQQNAMYLQGNEANGFMASFAFQGTDGLESLQFGDYVTNAVGDGGGLLSLHGGYMGRAMEIFTANPEINGIALDDLIAKAKNGEASFTLTGHSMGGAIAQCFAILLMNAGVPSSKITGYTFNCALPVTEDNLYYNKDLAFFNLSNQTDNVSRGDVVGLGESGARLGYDIPIADFGKSDYDSRFGLFPNGEHGMDYLGDRIGYDKTVIGCTGEHCAQWAEWEPAYDTSAAMHGR